MIVATGVAPWVEAHGWARVCSAQGVRWVQVDGDSHDQPLSDPAADHAVHCPLCLPVASPSNFRPLIFASDDPVATIAIRRDAAHPAAPVGAPFPPRAPPATA
jgi:hypothetical protein